MLEWKKQILRKRNFSLGEINEVTLTTNQNKVEEWVSQMQTYFYKLFSNFIKILNFNEPVVEVDCLYNIDWPIYINAPGNLSLKEQSKIVLTLYRRIKNIVLNLQSEQNLVNQLDDIFMNARQSPQLSVSTFFNRCCDLVIQEIGRIKRKRQKKNVNDKLLVNKKQIEKVVYNNQAKILCQTIYDILDLQEIEACQLFIQKVSVTHNVQYIYEKIKGKNKRARKQIKQHILNLEKYKSKQCKNLKQTNANSYEQAIMNNKKKMILEQIVKIKLKKSNSISNSAPKIQRSFPTQSKKQNQIFKLAKQRVKLQKIFKQKPKLKLK